MVQIGDVIVSLDIFREYFCCNLDGCSGACCIEGDAGAPVSMEEIALLEEVLPTIWDDLKPEARTLIEEQGVAYCDATGDLVTSIINGKDCVFSYTDEKGCCRCAIERAYFNGKTTFRKPVSCHLYPIRVGNIGDFQSVNYNRWSVCKAAVIKGKAEGVLLYKFLKEPLIRKFGADWYYELELVVSEMKKQNYL